MARTVGSEDSPLRERLGGVEVRASPKALIPIVVVTGLVSAGVWMDGRREARRSVLSGVFESEPTVLAARITGRVEGISAREGEAVTSGQELVRLEADSSAREAEATEAMATQAEARLREVEAGARAETIMAARATVEELRSNLERLTAGPTREARQAMAERVAAVRARYRAAVIGPRPEEVQAARAGVAEALARLESARRGPTPEERAQAAARLEAARAAEVLARREVDRANALYDEGALARRDQERAAAAARSATALREEAEAAKRRIDRGTPPEELRQVDEAFRAADGKRRLVESGVRAEDREALRAELSAFEAEQRELENGSRPEDVQAARARLAQAQAKLAESVAGSRPEVVDQARAAAQAARLRAEGGAAVVEDRFVRAPFDGVLDRVLVAKGDLVVAGTPIVRVSDPTDVWIRVYVPESDLAGWSPGKRVPLRVDGIAEAVEARVESVATQGAFTPANLQSPEDRGRQVFAVRLRTAARDARIKAGMAASVVTGGAR